jgi:hypothetical protein
VAAAVDDDAVDDDGTGAHVVPALLLPSRSDSSGGCSSRKVWMLEDTETSLLDFRKGRSTDRWKPDQ